MSRSRRRAKEFAEAPQPQRVAQHHPDASAFSGHFNPPDERQSPHVVQGHFNEEEPSPDIMIGAVAIAFGIGLILSQAAPSVSGVIVKLTEPLLDRLHFGGGQ